MSEIDGKPFTDVLGELEAGEFLREITRQLRKVTNAVRETRKAGALKVSLKLSPTGRGSIEIDAKYDATIPEHERPSTVFFTSPGGTLLRDDPDQPRLPLRSVPSNDQPLREVP